MICSKFYKWPMLQLLAIATAVGMSSTSASAVTTPKADVDVSAPGCYKGCGIELSMPPFGNSPYSVEVRQILQADLLRTGMYRFVSDEGASSQATKVQGNIRPAANTSVALELTVKRPGLGDLSLSVLAGPNQTRMASHELADRLHKALTGQASLFKSRLAFVSQDLRDGRLSYALTVADSDGQNRHELFRSPHPISAPAWSPSGQQIAYVGYMPYRGHPTPKPRVWVVNPYTGENRVLADYPGANTAPAWLPGGTVLALSLEKDGTAKIYTVNATNPGEPRRLTKSSPMVLETEPTASPNGDFAFTTDRSGSFQVNRYWYHLAGDSLMPLSSGAKEAYSPAFSPNGDKLAYVAQAQGGTQLVVKDMGLSTSRQIQNTSGAGRPSFAPNGRVIVFPVKRKDGNCELKSVPIDSPESTTTSLGTGCEPAWGPLLP